MEHDEEIIRAADYIIDIGLDAGRLGGNIIFEGKPTQTLAPGTSHTIDYLMGVFYGTRDDNQLCMEYLKKALDQTDPKKNSSDQVAIYQMLKRHGYDGCATSSSVP